ncbi:MAG: DUF5700 domain-containing putative Zn-dependent protease [Bacteroidota bacterium]
MGIFELKGKKIKNALVILFIFVSIKANLDYENMGNSFSMNGAKSIDFSGVDHFWPIMRNLKKDIEPPESDWNRLFATRCYQYIIQSTSQEKLKRRFRMAYMPQFSKERQAILQRGGYNARILNHLISVDKYKITRYIDSIQGNPFIEKSLQLTSTYLPENFIKENKGLTPTISFGVFEPDGQASRQIIAMDIWFAMGIDVEKFFAHEAHHSFISNIRRPTKEVDDEGLRFLLMSIRQLHLEGIADLIDKRDILANGNVSEEEDWYGYHYNKYFQEAKETLKKIDSLMKESSSLNGDAKGKEIWGLLHFGTHPEAMHMALTIENTFGKDHIIEILDNPFKIFWSYQKVASVRPQLAHKFSKESMDYLKSLEANYLTEPKN